MTRSDFLVRAWKGWAADPPTKSFLAGLIWPQTAAVRRCYSVVFPSKCSLDASASAFVAWTVT